MCIQPNGPAHKLRRYHLPCAKMPNVHRARRPHNSMTSLQTKGADSFMGLLGGVLTASSDSTVLRRAMFSETSSYAWLLL